MNPSDVRTPATIAEFLPLVARLHLEVGRGGR
jgi:hypothetical protein